MYIIVNTLHTGDDDSNVLEVMCENLNAYFCLLPSRDIFLLGFWSGHSLDACLLVETLGPGVSSSLLPSLK